jgi:glucose-6-phosphate isomerase
MTPTLRQRPARKVLAKRIIPELASSTERELAHDSSTNALLRRYRSLKARP